MSGPHGFPGREPAGDRPAAPDAGVGWPLGSTSSPGYPLRQEPPQPGWPAQPVQPVQPHGPHPYAAPQYGDPHQYGAPQYSGPQYGDPRYAATAHGGPAHWPSAPAGHGPPPPRRTGGRWVVAAALAAVLVVGGGALAVTLLVRGGAAPPPPAAAVVQGSSAPGTTIPDGSPIGLTDAIVLDGGDARVARLDVAVRFEHRFPGEVSGVLTAPDGRLATLVPAGSADAGTDLRLSSTEPASALQNLLGAPISGPWRLTLTDAVPADAGRLVSWTITARSGSAGAPPPVAGSGPGSGSSAPGEPVPDATGEAASDTIELTGAGTVERVRVSVQVQHPEPTDLLLQLRAPDGQLVTLADHVDAAPSTYASSDPGSPLAALVGGPLAGPWELVVLDDVGVDEGTLVAWELSVDG